MKKNLPMFQLFFKLKQHTINILLVVLCCLSIASFAQESSSETITGKEKDSTIHLRNNAVYGTAGAGALYFTGTFNYERMIKHYEKIYDSPQSYQ